MTLLREDAWQLRGNCRQYDPELFFTPEGEREGPQQTKRERVAKAICNDCPVSGNCLDAALAGNEAGIWGGTSWKNRLSLKRRGLRVHCIRCGSTNSAKVTQGQICLHCGLSWLV